jgi:hypothetical protein
MALHRYSWTPWKRPTSNYEEVHILSGAPFGHLQSGPPSEPDPQQPCRSQIAGVRQSTTVSKSPIPDSPQVVDPTCAATGAFAAPKTYLFGVGVIC